MQQKTTTAQEAVVSVAVINELLSSLVCYCSMFIKPLLKANDIIVFEAELGRKGNTRHKLFSMKQALKFHLLNGRINNVLRMTSAHFLTDSPTPRITIT